MRLIGAASILYILMMALAISQVVTASSRQLDAAGIAHGREARPDEGKAIFRYDTFGDGQLWTDVLRMHDVIPAIDPVTALAVGLKVDVDALPPSIVDALR